MAKRKPQTQPITKTQPAQNKKFPSLPIALAVIALLILAAAGWMVLSRNTSTPTIAGAMPAEISVEEAYKLYQNGTFLLDVRNQDEWDDFHAPNATLIPLGELKARFAEIPQDQPVVVICNSGNRSKPGRDFLLESGFKNVTSVSGGMQAWRKAGYPVE